MSDPEGDLERLCDDVLIDGLRPGLRASIDKLLAAGVPAEAILARVRRLTGGPRAQPGAMTYLACEAYLERKTGKGGDA